MAMMIRIPSSISSLSLLHFAAKPFLSKTLHARPYTIPTFAAAETSIESPSTSTTLHRQLHPWPEWVDFIERLKSQGYFPQTSSSSNGGGTDLVYDEMNLLKDPCLSFARDRYDIFGSLSKEDIRAIVEGGCPKVLRKVVNSAKRLRVYAGLDESNVCSACSLRESCDRAYVTLKESDQGARTVDLVRLLLFYALDPLVMSEAVGSQSVDQANSSARKLLKMLTTLSETSPDLAPVQPSSKDSYPAGLASVRPSSKNSYQKKEKIPSKKPVVADNNEIKKKDWMCPECSFMNFSRNVQCRKCNAENPKGDNVRHVEMKRGDWNCPQCATMNFASRSNCFRCKESRPPRNLNPGEWECPKCDFLNFRKNMTCFKCGNDRVREATSQYEEQFWRRPQ